MDPGSPAASLCSVLSFTLGHRRDQDHSAPARTGMQHPPASPSPPVATAARGAAAAATPPTQHEAEATLLRAELKAARAEIAVLREQLRDAVTQTSIPPVRPEPPASVAASVREEPLGGVAGLSETEVWAPLFADIDADGSGEISLEELGEYLKGESELMLARSRTLRELMAGEREGEGSGEKRGPSKG
eukprot:3173867-Rhodomonas_salina.1